MEAIRSTMGSKSHWERVYQTKSPQERSWYQPHSLLSLNWITEAAPEKSASIIDVGGGDSTLADDLFALQYRALTVLDIAEAAVKNSQSRLGPAAKQIQWLTGDVTKIILSPRAYDVWHDRAVFHFLTQPEQRSAYVRQLASALKIGGHVVIATFGPNGPEQCSGLLTRRYNAQSLHHEFGPNFQLAKSSLADHQTPFGTTQQFLYCQFILS